MPFVKLDCGILDSSLWSHGDLSKVFITALLMAQPKYFDKPQKAIEIDSMKETGFILPPGDYGFIEASGPGILHRAHVPKASGTEALKLLGQPEAESRSSDYDGRRLIRIDGGFVALNYDKYREKDYTNAERQARFRDRKRNGRNAVIVTPVTQAEAEAYNISLPTLSTNPPPADPKPATQPNEERVPDPIEKPQETAEDDAWIAWKTGFVNTSPIDQHSPAALAALRELLRSWGPQELTRAAAAFKRDCDLGRIIVKSLQTFVKCSKNYAPKTERVKPDMVRDGQQILLDRLKTFPKDSFWNMEQRDRDYYLRWYGFLQKQDAVPDAIPAP